MWHRTDELVITKTARFWTEHDNWLSWASKDINWNNWQFQYLEVDESTVITFTNLPTSCARLQLKIKMLWDGLDVSFPANTIFVNWDFDFTKGETDDYTILTFYYDGTNYFVANTRFFTI